MSTQVSPQAPARSLVGDIAGIVIPIIVLALGAGVLGWSIANRPDPETTPEEVVIPTVRTVAAEPYQQNMQIDVDGIVVPHREIQLPTEVSGIIVRRAEHCRAGKFVRAGDVLFEVDPLDFELETKRLKQEVKQAQMRIDETKVDIVNTRRLIKLSKRDAQLQDNDVRRMTKLGARSAVAKSEVDRALRGQVTAENALQTLINREQLLTAQLETARTALQLVSTRLEVAQIDLDRTKVRSPMDGVVVQENCEVDSFVQKGATLVTIEDTSAVEVLCNLRTDQIRWLWRGQNRPTSTGPGAARNYELPPSPANIVFRSDDQEFVWQGVVSRYDGIGLDPRTRTVPCRILIAQPTKSSVRRSPTTFQPESVDSATESYAIDEGGPNAGGPNAGGPNAGGPGALVRGMFVNVEIQIEPAGGAELLSLPIAAIRPGDKIWVMDDKQLSIRSAKIAKTLKDEVLIQKDGSDIDLEDRIIVSPLPAVTEGMSVKEAATI